jgi:thiamine kinase-like enzyme
LAALPKALVPLHGDLALTNMIKTHHGIKFIDWEAAGMGDRWAEVAAVIFQSRIGPEDALMFLSHYFGDMPNGDQAEATGKVFLYWILHIYRWAADFEQRAQGLADPKVELKYRDDKINEFRYLLSNAVFLEKIGIFSDRVTGPID